MPGILRKLRQAFVNLKYKLGWMSKDEIIRELLPEREQMMLAMPSDARTEIRQIVNQLDDFRTMSDLPRFWGLTRDLATKFAKFADKYPDNEALKDVTSKLNYITGVDAIGYRPSSARVWRFFLNPAGVYTFFFEQHHACKAAIDVWTTEVIHDGWRTVADQSVPDSRLAEVEKLLDRLNIWQLRLDLLRHYLIYGNALVLVHKNPFGVPIKFELLVFDRCEPIYDRFTEKLLGWDVTTGHRVMSYTNDQLLHLKNPSLSRPDIGLPPISCLITDLEACMGGSSLNNTMMQKAGMVSVLIALEDPATKRAGDKTFERALKELRQEIQANFSGSKAGGSLMASNFVKNVFKLSQMREWDGAFLKFRAEIARTVATILGVPLGKMNIPLLAQAQYEASSLKDKNDADYDKRIAAVMTHIDRFINQGMLQASLNIHDVRIMANGRTSMTLQSARASKVAADTGPLFTVNEHRTKFYGQQPLPTGNKRGRQVVDNSKNREQNSHPPQYDEGEQEDSSVAPDPQDDAHDSEEES
jgi:hypothetical protein